MFKNIQIKIVILFTVIGIAIISALGLFFINELNVLNSDILTNQLTIEQVTTNINNIFNQTKITLIISKN